MFKIVVGYPTWEIVQFSLSTPKGITYFQQLECQELPTAILAVLNELVS